jgi:hypothetical protein
MVRRSIRFTVALVAAVAVAGCQDDQIRHYRVPRIEPPATRLLAAILPFGEKVWFVSVSGPAPAVGDLLPQFERFVQTIRFPENQRRRVTWDLPADWHREPSREPLRYATFRAGPNALEVKVNAFGPESGDLLNNVNRWRGQIGLVGIKAEELSTISRPITVNGVAGTFVDMTGPGANAAPPPAASPTRKASGEKLAYGPPPGWEPLPADPAIPLAGVAGGKLANVNRWRKEVDLPPATEAELQKTGTMVDSPAGAVTCVDLTGPGGKRTLGGILFHGGTSWFVKLQGPADLVGKQKAAFEAFVKSLRFEAGAE